MHRRPGLNRSNDREPVEPFRDLRHQSLRKPSVTIAGRVEVRRRPRAFLQVKGIDMAGGAGEKDEYAIARGPSGRDLRGCLHLQGTRDLGEVVAREGGAGHSEELPPAESRAIPKGIVRVRLSAASESIFRGHALKLPRF